MSPPDVPKRPETTRPFLPPAETSAESAVGVVFREGSVTEQQDALFDGFFFAARAGMAIE